MISKITKVSSAVGFAMLMPFMALAQNTGNVSGVFFENIVKFIGRMMTLLFPIITGALIILFGYQVIRFLTDKDIESKAVHKGALIKALIAIFLWFTLFGLINLIARAVGVEVGSDVGASEVPIVTLPM